MVVLEATHMVIKSRYYKFKVSSSYKVASQHIMELLPAYFKIKNAELKGKQEKEATICVSGDRKICPFRSLFVINRQVS